MSFYNKRKKEIKDEYSPSSRKALTPNYYQRKGRTLQNQVGFIPNPPNEIISHDILDQYYAALKKFKYKNANFDYFPSGFNFILNLSLQQIFKDHPVYDPDQPDHILYYEFHPQHFKAICNQYMSTHYPQLMGDYVWEYQLNLIQWNTDGVSQPFAQNIQFAVDLIHNLFNLPETGNSVTLFYKTLNPPILPSITGAILALQPYNYTEGHVNLQYQRTTVSGEGGYNYTAYIAPTKDITFNDNGDYTYMFSEAAGQPGSIKYSFFRLVYNTEYTDVSPNQKVRLLILALPYPAPAN